MTSSTSDSASRIKPTVISAAWRSRENEIAGPPPSYGWCTTTTSSRRIRFGEVDHLRSEGGIVRREARRMDDDELVDLLVRVERDARADQLVGLLRLRVVRDLALGRQVADEGRGERDADEHGDAPDGQDAPRVARAPVREAAHAVSIVLRGARVTPSPRDPAARSGRRPPADRLPRHLLRVPVGHDAVARARPLPHLRRAVGRRAARLDRRVRAARAEALRRHRPDPRRDRRVGLRQRATASARSGG